jgi:hypothetical protein
MYTNPHCNGSGTFEDPPGFDPSLKLGRGAIACSKNPLAGTRPRPSGEGRIQIVPPVMIIRTLDSGYWDAATQAEEAIARWPLTAPSMVRRFAG